MSRLAPTSVDKLVGGFGQPRYWAITADQKGSRRSSDRVPEALAILERLDSKLILPFERTAGDEIQALTTDSTAIVDIVLSLTQLGGWHLGFGLGSVETPIPTSTRAARGSAYIAARQAINNARSAPANLCLCESEPILRASDEESALRHAEWVLILLRALASRRTSEGWEIAAALDRVKSGSLVAKELGISPSAVSQRSSRAAVREVRMGARLAVALLDVAMGEKICC